MNEHTTRAGLCIYFIGISGLFPSIGRENTTVECEKQLQREKLKPELVYENHESK